jgi:hypothetical protein
MPLAVSRQLPTEAARVRAWVWSCGICGGRSGAGAGFLRVFRFSSIIFIPPTAPQLPSSNIWGWHNRSEVAAVPSGLKKTFIERYMRLLQNGAFKTVPQTEHCTSHCCKEDGQQKPLPACSVNTHACFRFNKIYRRHSMFRQRMWITLYYELNYTVSFCHQANAVSISCSPSHLNSSPLLGDPKLLLQIMQRVNAAHSGS